MSNELVVIEKENALELFTNKDKFELLLENLESKLVDFDHDMSTGVSRKRTASFAAAFAKTKTYIDGEGKKLVDDLKKLPKEIDSTRKMCRDRLDEMKVKARQPLTEWEAEQESIKAEQERQDLIKIIDSDFDNAKEMMIEHFAILERKEAERKAAEEKARIEYEERIQREAKENAEREAQLEIERQARKAALDIERAELERKQAIERQAQLEREAQESARRAELEKQRQIELEEQRKIQEEQRLRQEEMSRLQAIEQARIDEINRQNAEKLAQEEEYRKREENKRHVGAIRKQSKEALMREVGVDEETAKAIVMAIIKGSIPNVKINY